MLPIYYQFLQQYVYRYLKISTYKVTRIISIKITVPADVHPIRFGHFFFSIDLCHVLLETNRIHDFISRSFAVTRAHAILNQNCKLQLKYSFNLISSTFFQQLTLYGVSFSRQLKDNWIRNIDYLSKFRVYMFSFATRFENIKKRSKYATIAGTKNSCCGFCKHVTHLLDRPADK